MRASKKRSAKKVVASKPRPEIKEVALPAVGIVRVVAPPGVLPVVAVDPVKHTVEIIPVRKRRSWWSSLFS